MEGEGEGKGSYHCVLLVAMEKQRKELARYKATGSRVLSLDGGGMKGKLHIITIIKHKTLS